MAIGLIRKWSDVGAPKLWANAYGSIIALLKAVLVDGYGAFSPLGWTLEYSSGDNTRAVFRNSPTGTGTFLRVNNSNDGRAVTTVDISAYESMGSLDDFSLSRCPALGISQYLAIGYNNASSCPDGIHWYFIGDNLGFWFLWRPYLTAYTNISSLGKIWYCTYIGDYIPVNITNKKNWFQSGSVATGTNLGPFGTVSSSASGTVPGYYCLRGSSFDEGSVVVGLQSGSLFELTALGQSNQISPMNGVLHHSIPILFDVINNNPNMLGFLPGLVNPLIKAGNNGVSDTNLQDSEIVMGNKTLNLFKYRPDGNTTYDLLKTIGIFSGEGFRDVL